MTKIDGEYLVTDEASVGLLFLEKEVQWWNPAKKKWECLSKSMTMGDLAYAYGQKLRMHRALVREAIEPGYEQGTLSWLGSYLQDATPEYRLWPKLPYIDAVALNAITIGKTVGELRKFVEWANA